MATPLMTTKATIWFDMDGVLSEYNHKDYLEPDYNYQKPNYFLERPVNPVMQELFVRLATTNQLNLQRLGVISKVQPEIPKFLEESADKKQWVKNNLQRPLHATKSSVHNVPYPPLFTGHNESKAKKVMANLGRPLTQADILIDDYNSNLEDWVAHGGTAIKYGLGDKKTWKSYSFTDDLTVQQMLTFLATVTLF